LLQKQSTPDCVRRKALQGVGRWTVLHTMQSDIRWDNVTVPSGGNERLTWSLQQKVWPLGRFVNSEINKMGAFYAEFQ